MSATEYVVAAQENVCPDTPEVWRDVSVPQIRTTGLGGRLRNVTVEEWGDQLVANKLTGTYRAVTNEGRIMAIIVSTTTTFMFQVEDRT